MELRKQSLQIPDGMACRSGKSKHNLPQAAVLRLTPSGVSSQAAEFHKHVSSKDPD